MTPRWFAQPFPPAGSISAEGIKRTLGKPPLPWPMILVRETAQNSWDAKRGDGAVRFRLDLGAVLPQHVSVWRDLLLQGAPRHPLFPLQDFLRGRDGRAPVIRTLTVSDRGTNGLGGPTRADRARGDGPRDWVSFILNVGDPPDTVNGGGTYGYGKGILYQMSRADAVLVHTRTRTDDGLENRLIGVCLGESVELPDGAGGLRPYTGRYWWGDVRDDQYVEPLVGDEAVRIAGLLGLPAFDGDDTGSDLVIIDPDFGEQEDDAVARYLADAIAWNLWPIMLADRGADRLEPEVIHLGERVPVPVPETTPGLRAFVTAYRHLDDKSGDSHTLRCEKPKHELGRLSLQRRLEHAFDPPDAAQDLGIAGTPHHVCLMRSPELVVRYYKGPVAPSGQLAYGGVFRAFDELDRTFANAEPPTHDDWIFAQLEGYAKTYVRTTFRRIDEKLAEFTRPAPSESDAAAAPLGAVSNFLGSLVGAAAGSGAASVPFMFRRLPLAMPAEPGTTTDERNAFDGRDGGTGRDRADGASGTPEQGATYRDNFAGGYPAAGSELGSAIDGFTASNPRPPSGDGEARAATGVAGRPPARATLRAQDDPYFDEFRSELVLVQRIQVVNGGGLAIRGSAGVLTADGTREAEPPENAPQPTVLGWRTGDAFVDGDQLELPYAQPRQIIDLIVRVVPDTVTVVDYAAVGRG